MPARLLDRGETDLAAGALVKSVGEVFTVFGALTQDSGNVSYGVIEDGERFFVKSAGPREGRDDPDVTLSHGERVLLLRNAIELHREVQHPALPALLNVIESPDGPLLVQRFVDGELLHAKRRERDDPASAFARFRALPEEAILQMLDSVYGVHRQLAQQDWVAVDFYDGSLIYDFVRREVHVVDLDHYHRGPLRNARGRMFGSTRFMAPEEHHRGATIDQRTTVFTLGRSAAVLLSDGTLERAAFRGNEALFEVMTRACEAKPEDRFGDVAAFHAAWQTARAQ